MAASGPPSQRKISVSTLVYSTLGPSLGLLPSEAKVNEDPGLQHGRDSVGEEAVFVEQPNEDIAQTGKTTRPQRMSDTAVIETQSEKDKAKKPDSSESLSRLYSAPASNFGQKGRFGFQSKAGAGSVSSMEQATLDRRTSNAEDGAEAPSSPVSKQLQSQISPKTSLGDTMSPR